MVFRWQKGVGALSEKLGSVDLFQSGVGTKVYHLVLHGGKLVRYYLCFHSNIGYCQSSA